MVMNYIQSDRKIIHVECSIVYLSKNQTEMDWKRSCPILIKIRRKRTERTAVQSKEWSKKQKIAKSSKTKKTGNKVTCSTEKKWYDICESSTCYLHLLSTKQFLGCLKGRLKRYISVRTIYLTWFILRSRISVAFGESHWSPT